MEADIPDKNLFMMCRRLNRSALREMPDDYYIRNCRESELDIWKSMPFDTPALAERYSVYMTEFFNNVYGKREGEFFRECLFVCDRNDNPAGTCFIWKAYQKIHTIHWFKVKKDLENRGLGRALLSAVMKDLPKEHFPVYLHTQPGSYRAIKLYSDFGFALLSNPLIGSRKNDLEECLPILKEHMPREFYGKLKIAKAPKYFLDAVKTSSVSEF